VSILKKSATGSPKTNRKYPPQKQTNKQKKQRNTKQNRNQKKRNNPKLDSPRGIKGGFKKEQKYEMSHLDPYCLYDFCMENQGNVCTSVWYTKQKETNDDLEFLLLC